MPHVRTLVILSLFILFLSEAKAQQPTYPRTEDVSTLDGIIRAYYEVVSGPANELRDWARDRSLHHPDALVAITGKDEGGRPTIRTMTLAEFHESSTGLEAGFFESEIHRVTEQFGNVTHVWSTYAWKNAEDGPIMGRGINSIQLYHDGERWWVTSWVFDSERDDNPIPARYLPQKQ